MNYDVTYRITDADGNAIPPDPRVSTLDLDLTDDRLIDMEAIKDSLWPQRHESGLFMEVTDITASAV